MAKQFKKCVMNGIPNELRGIIWKAAIDPLNSEFDILKTDIIDFIETSIDETFTTDDLKNTQKFINDENKEEENSAYVSSFYSNAYSNSDFSQRFYETSTNDESLPMQVSYSDNEENSRNKIIQCLVKQADENVIKEIEKDLDRTLVQFDEMENERLKNSMKNILAAYSVIDKDIDYVQGMAFIVGIFLCYMDECSAFNCFCVLMFSKRFNFRECFIDGFPGVNKMNKVWNAAMQKYFPKIHRRFIENEIDPMMYTVSWWLTAFSGLPFKKDIILLIFDRFLLFGSSSLISFGLICLNVYNDYLNYLSIDDIISFLQNPSIHSFLNDISYVKKKMNKRFLISEKQYKKIMKKSFN